MGAIENPDGIRLSRKVIYDFGANNGDDLLYYLKKADLVVAVEANPLLCRQMEDRFSAAVQSGKLCIENCVLVAEPVEPEAHFYLHKRHSVLGQFPRPDESVIRDYDRVLVRSESVMNILHKHGAPFYIKLDIEGYDAAILKELFRNQVTPPFLSAESTSIQVFALLVAMGGYKAFKLVEGAKVAKDFKDCSIAVNGISERYSFPPHSAGPFGEDIPGDWLNADDLFEILAARKMGWRDIHATRLFDPDPTSKAQKKRYLTNHLRGWLLSKLRSAGKMAA
ncbi:MAG TPA: FkbM family methyltransferase [Terracidiphilus sp.]|jgi:FkbM family methyltransferase